MAKLSQAAKTILKRCMGVKRGESVLIITDKNKLSLANVIYNQAKKLTDSAIIEIPIGKIHGQEPPSSIAKEMKKYDVIIILTTKSLSHTKARRDASKKGARIASMPGATKAMIERTIVLDYNKMKKLGTRLAKILTKGKQAKLTTKKGTDLTLSIKARKARGGLAGILKQKGAFDNLPAGEACIAPVEKTANGILIIDASLGGFGKVDKPIKIQIKNGFAKKIEGGKLADKFKRILKQLKNKNVYNIAELGIGTNQKAKITGNVLEDEKAKGTAHVALGDNISLGGKTKAPCHVDGVIKSPTIFIDGKVIIKDGKSIF